MNILTKICIVLLLVVTLCASMVFLSWAVKSENYREKYIQQEREKTVALQEAIRLKDELRAAKEEGAGLRGLLNRTRGLLEAEQNRNQQTLASLAADDRDILASLVEVRNRDAAFVVVHNDYMGRTKDLLAVSEKLREKNDGLASTLRLKDDELQQRKADLERLRGRLVLAQEQITEREQRIAELQTRIQELQDELLQGGPGVAQPAPAGGTGGILYAQEGAGGTISIGQTAVGPPSISGRIQGVRDNLASINVGSGQGVDTGMRMLISRGGSLVGYLVIERVTGDSAAGVVENRQMAPQVGDVVSYPVPKVAAGGTR